MNNSDIESLPLIKKTTANIIHIEQSWFSKIKGFIIYSFETNIYLKKYYKSDHCVLCIILLIICMAIFIFIFGLVMYNFGMIYACFDKGIYLTIYFNTKYEKDITQITNINNINNINNTLCVSYDKFETIYKCYEY